MGIVSSFQYKKFPVKNIGSHNILIFWKLETSSLETSYTGTSLHCPGSKSPSSHSPIRTRISLRVG